MRLKALLAESAGDPYAGADLENAARLGALAWILAAAVGIALFPISPPTRALGAAGWAIASANALVALAGARRLVRHAGRSFDQLYLMSFLALGQIALVEWLAGGRGTPYHQLYLLVATYVGGVHPPRRVLAFLGVVGVAASAPLAYRGWDAVSAADIFTQLLLIYAVTLVATVLMVRVRAQRVALRSDNDFAKKLARVDALTGLGNRRAFEEALERESATAQRSGTRLLVLLGDIDHFKQVNDDSGHTDGDRCLRQVGSVLADTLRGGDSCFRWGGDEFAVLLPGHELEAGREIAARLEAAVTSLCSRPDGLPMTLTWGIAQLEPGMAPATAVDFADAMLLSRKRRSRESSLAAMGDRDAVPALR